MFTLCLVDVSTTRTIAVGVRIPRRPIYNFHFCRRNSAFSRPPTHALRLRSASPPSVLLSFSMDNFFVNALVRASLCKIHSSSYPLVGYREDSSIGVGARVGIGGGGTMGRGDEGGYFRNCSPSRLLASTPKRGYSHGIIGAEPRPPYSQALKSELISFTDPYFDPDTPPSDHDEEKAKAIAVRRLQFKNAHKLPWLTPSTSEDKEALEDFLGYLEKPDISLEYLFRLYRKLPVPRLPYLTLSSVNLFVSRMMTVPTRTELSMLRYLSILDDMKAVDLPISRNEWNAAISFVARAFREVTTREAKSAIQIWKESELIVGCASDTTTFNILLDMASKSDIPVLADWIIREMENRGIGSDRFTHTTIITYHGFRGEGERVRAAYRDLVDAGEIVDTVVLNAVISALFRANQPQSADYIYQNMKRATIDPPYPLPTIGPTDWRGKRSWAQNLKRIAEQRRIIKDYMEKFNASLSPDVYTFNMLILENSRAGDYDKAQVLLGEMKECSVDMDETIFVAVLKGFYWYGGMQYSPWTPERLDTVIKQVFEENFGILMERSLAIWILRAVAKVYNSKREVLKAWDIIERRWESQGGVTDEAATKVLHELVGWNIRPRERKEEEQAVEEQMEKT